MEGIFFFFGREDMHNCSGYVWVQRLFGLGICGLGSVWKGMGRSVDDMC